MDVDDLLAITEELRVSDAEQQRHIESIHIAVTTLIIASFFTPAVQDSINQLGVESHTNVLFVVSVVYLAIRLVDVTIPIRRMSGYADTLFTFIAPLLFVAILITYLTYIAIAVLNVQISTNKATIIAGIGLLISIILSTLNYKSGGGEPIESNSYHSTVNKAMDFQQLVFDHPEIIESGLKWVRQESMIGRIAVDLIGEDSDGEVVYGELKFGDLDRRRSEYVVSQYESLIGRESADDGRFLLITNGKVSESAKRILEDYDIEIVNIDIDVVH